MDHEELEQSVRLLLRLVVLNQIDIQALQATLPGAENERFSGHLNTLRERNASMLKLLEDGGASLLDLVQVIGKSFENS